LNAVEDDHWRFVRNTLLPTFSSGKMRKVSDFIKLLKFNAVDLIDQSNFTPED
jgi:hypothetical protein